MSPSESSRLFLTLGPKSEAAAALNSSSIVGFDWASSAGTDVGILYVFPRIAFRFPLDVAELRREASIGSCSFATSEKPGGRAPSVAAASEEAVAVAAAEAGTGAGTAKAVPRGAALGAALGAAPGAALEVVLRAATLAGARERVAAVGEKSSPLFGRPCLSQAPPGEPRFPSIGCSFGAGVVDPAVRGVGG